MRVNPDRYSVEVHCTYRDIYLSAKCMGEKTNIGIKEKIE